MVRSRLRVLGDAGQSRSRQKRRGMPEARGRRGRNGGAQETFRGLGAFKGMKVQLSIHRERGGGGSFYLLFLSWRGRERATCRFSSLRASSENEKSE